MALLALAISVMILEGPARGNIYAWTQSVWPGYDGIEAESYLEWQHSGWTEEEERID